MVDLYHLVLGGVHVLTVVVLVGGGFFANRVLQPSLEALSPPERGKLMQGVSQRFTAMLWMGIVLIAASGLLRADYIGVLTMDVLFGTTYGLVLVAKMAIFSVMILLAAMVTRLNFKMTDPPSKDFVAKAQKRIKIYAETNSGLGLLVIVLAVGLRIMGL